MARSAARKKPIAPVSPDDFARLGAVMCLFDNATQARLHKRALADGCTIADFVTDAVILALDEADAIGAPKGERPFDHAVAIDWNGGGAVTAPRPAEAS